MTTSKKAQSGSKVRNTKATYHKSVNKIAEANMRRSFEPLLSSKDNKARLTFCGVKHSVIEWSKNGKEISKPVMLLAFSCFDVTHENPQVLAITCDYRLSAKNRLGQILTLMGYIFTDETEVVDADDEFGVKQKQTDSTEIFNFFREKCGLVFKAELKPALRKNKTTGEKYEAYGLWDIDYKTIEPLMSKTGEQQRDLMASDVSDEDFQNPDIDDNNASLSD